MEIKKLWVVYKFLRLSWVIKEFISPHRALGAHKFLSSLGVLGPYRVLVLIEFWVLLGS